MIFDTTDIETHLASLPDVLRATFDRLKAMDAGDQSEIARAALYHLYRLVREVEAS
jgi:hypothetical protein